MELTVEISGDVVEWQELLNGLTNVTLDGASADGEWTLSGALSWNIGLRANAGEGDITLSRADGAEIYGTIVTGEVTAMREGDVEDADHSMHLDYEIDGGTGGFDSASGRARATGTLSRSGFRGTWSVELEPGAPA